MKSDVQSGINNIDWTVYGKIYSITNTDATKSVTYTYDPGGKRATKTNAGVTTFYVRDAQGNPLAIYDNAGGTINWKEQDLYGSSRLGTWTPGTDASAWLSSGNKQYELTNHLGNVLATVSDRRVQVADPNSSTTLQSLTADVITAQDYYPFGMLQPGRQYISETSGATAFRYGFNGKENDNEVKGVGNQQDYGMRIYDPRIGKFLSVDPLSRNYPMLTSYQFASNDPVESVDADGEERVDYRLTRNNDGTTTLTKLSTGPTTDRVYAQYGGIRIPWIYTTKEVPYYVRIEYNGQHYLFANGGAKSKIATVGAGDEYTPNYDANINYARYIVPFVKNPVAFKGVLTSEEDGDIITQNRAFRMAAAEAIVDGMAAAVVGAVHNGNSEAVESDVNSTTRKFNPNKPALTKENLKIPASDNGNAPDFAETPHLYPTVLGKNNIVNIKLTGSYTADFEAANKEANLDETPTGYTWHHLDDYNSKKGTATMQLVKTSVHIKTIPHSGSVKQYENHNGVKYKN